MGCTCECIFSVTERFSSSFLLPKDFCFGFGSVMSISTPLTLKNRSFSHHPFPPTVQMPYRSRTTSGTTSGTASTRTGSISVTSGIKTIILSPFIAIQTGEGAQFLRSLSMHKNAIFLRFSSQK